VICSHQGIHGVSYNLVVLLLGLTAILPAILTARAWNQRRAAGMIAVSMAVLMGAITAWVLIYLLEIRGSNPVLKTLAFQGKFLSIASIPVIWLTFSLYYTGRGGWVTRRNLLLLSIVPVITTIIVWTSNSHQLMWQNPEIVQEGELFIFNAPPGIWFWIHAAYSYVLILAGDYFLFRQFAGSPGLYRRQLTALLVGVIVPLIANAITIFSTIPLDLTPFGFVVTGSAVMWGLLRYQFLDLSPIARNAVIDSMTDGMIVLDTQSRVVDLNFAAQKIIGKESSAVIGKRIHEVILSILTPQPELLERYTSDDTVQGEILLKNGTTTLDVRVSPLHDRQGKLTGRVVIFRDISERKRAEQKIQDQYEALVKANHELALARQQADQANVMKSQFLATMSHELRTPLTAIIGYTELQLAGMAGELKAEQVNYQNRVLANAEHLLGLINDVLDLSKIEAGGMELARRPFDVRNWVSDIVTQNRVLAEEKGLEFGVEIEAQMPEMVIGDAARLKQIAINLLSNAIKFTDKGSVNLQVGAYDADTWKLVVTDTGMGIPVHAQDTIFEEFRQVDNTSTRRHGGTGLGLAIVRKLALMMGGTIRVKSELGRGSTFTMILPYLKETEIVIEPQNGRVKDFFADQD
jgi:PAS domain S-box-containing protein